MKSWLNSEQYRILDELAPERIRLGSGRAAKIVYHAIELPTIAARIQDLYGEERMLTAGRGRVPVRVQILAPNHRPIQVTSDLASFWADAYPRIKKELERKYPKHEWR